MNSRLYAAALTALFLLQGCNGDPAQVKNPIRPVKTIVAADYGAGKQWTFAGTAEDALETDLSFRVGGKIVDFPGDQIGRRFAKDEIIAELDPADYELELRRAAANLEQIRANHVRAKADLRRNSQLFKRSVISQSELDEIQADFKSFDAQLRASEKQLDIADKRLGYTTLRAPFDGWIGSVEAQIHQNVKSGQTVVAFNAGRRMKMYIAVPDTLISRVKDGDDVEVRFDALPGRVMKGKVMEVSVDVDEGSAYPVKVYLDNAENLVRSGMTGNVRFLGKADDGRRVFLPPVAVVGGAGGNRSVWVVDPGTSTVVNKQVKVGGLSKWGLEIIDGVRPGDRVVVRGVHNLKQGLKVRVNAENTGGRS